MHCGVVGWLGKTWRGSFERPCKDVLLLQLQHRSVRNKEGENSQKSSTRLGWAPGNLELEFCLKQDFFWLRLPPFHAPRLTWFEGNRAKSLKAEKVIQWWIRGVVMDRGNLNPKEIMTSEVYFFLCSLLPSKMTEEQYLCLMRLLPYTRLKTYIALIFIAFCLKQLEICFCKQPSSFLTITATHSARIYRQCIHSIHILAYCLCWKPLSWTKNCTS